MLGEDLKFIEQVTFVGCPYLVYPPAEYRPANQTEPLQVVIFPSDINLSADHHYTLNYALAFMKNCAELAISHPDINFVIKNKEPHYTKVLMSHEEFVNLYQKTSNNFKFSDRARHEYYDLLLSANIIIAMGFTTPGTEGLLLGKRTIYYNELNYGGQALNQIPDLIARNPSELAVLFEQALQDYHTYYASISRGLDRLDPFRDAQALERMAGILAVPRKPLAHP
jgi:polysaccharide biosynthesis PFTS motif protein